jgi:hypothetical protein
MAQTSLSSATPADGQPHRSQPSISRPPNPDPGLPAGTPPVADANELQRAGVARTRLCVLCGHPLRAGQHMIRVHGSTIHARCSSTSQ